MEDLGLLVSCAVKPTLHTGQEAVAQQAQSWEADSIALPPAFPFELLLLFLLFLFLEFMCLPSAEIAGEKGYPSPGILSTSAHVPFLLLPPQCFS